MHKHIGGGINGGKFMGVTLVGQPMEIGCGLACLVNPATFGTFADDHHGEAFPGIFLDDREGLEQPVDFLFSGETSDEEEEELAVLYAKALTPFHIAGRGLEDIGLDAERDKPGIVDAEIVQYALKLGGGNERGGELTIESANIGV